MEAVKKKPDAKDAMAAEEEADSNRSISGPSSSGTMSAKPGYFRIYKKGQGYWTRMGTVAAIALIGLWMGNFLFDQLDSWFQSPSMSPFLSAHGLQEPRGATLAVTVFTVAYCWLMFHLLNRPSNADFLIATDSEMKRVNWTSQKDLIGSTRVVIFFMLVVALFLFLADLFFHTIFYELGVLKEKPPFFH
jgi:preprotein translocase SecE subunit